MEHHIWTGLFILKLNSKRQSMLTLQMGQNPKCQEEVDLTFFVRKIGDKVYLCSVFNMHRAALFTVHAVDTLCWKLQMIHFHPLLHQCAAVAAKDGAGVFTAIAFDVKISADVASCDALHDARHQQETRRHSGIGGIRAAVHAWRCYDSSIECSPMNARQCARIATVILQIVDIGVIWNAWGDTGHAAQTAV
jgi:hypothetical protein